MKQPVKMPTLSDTMQSGRLLRWLKQEGAAVEKGDAIAEIETDKAVMEMEAFHAGVLRGPLAEEDHEYPVGETLAWIGDAASGGAGTEHVEAAEAEPTTSENVPAEREARGPSDETDAQPESETPPARIDRAPEASAVLEHALAGRAPGRVQADADATAYVLRELAAGPPFRVEAQRQLRRVIATTVSQAVQTPQFRVSTQADLTACKEYAKARETSFTLLLAMACALTVKDLPDFNAAWTSEGLARRERVDVAIAMEAEHGLLSPTLRDVATRPLSQLMEDWQALKERIKSHRMAPQDCRGATFYLSNLGMFPGVLQFDAIVPPGAAAILAVAAPGQSGSILTLTCDHRVIFGADAAHFLALLAERLATPDAWAS